MDGETVSFFNQIGAGTFICILLTVSSIGALIYEKLKTFKKNHKVKIEEEIKEDMEFKELAENIKSLQSIVPKVEKLFNNVENLQEKFEKHLIEGKKDFVELNKKVDESAKRLDSYDHTNEVDIRAFILSEYQKWMALNYIDVYSLSVIKDKFNVYKNTLHANHFVAELVNQLSELPPKYVITNSNGQDPINYFNKHPEEYPSNKLNRLHGDIIIESD